MLCLVVNGAYGAVFSVVGWCGQPDNDMCRVDVDHVTTHTHTHTERERKIQSEKWTTSLWIRSFIHSASGCHERGGGRERSAARTSNYGMDGGRPGRQLAGMAAVLWVSQSVRVCGVRIKLAGSTRTDVRYVTSSPPIQYNTIHHRSTATAM
mmetsp:Transcript_40473/g.115368  ORF Transcript_40473/g.115368 Transcript_40473/m.115368 type:complete len:152 (+) Transcript_40473:410-865(+)